MRKVVAKHISVPATSYLGKINEVSIENNELRVHDGVTPGGFLVGKSGTVPENIVFVNSVTDLLSFSAVVSYTDTVITLKDNFSYYFTTSVDLLGRRLVGGRNTVILGSSSENSSILSTGLSADTAIITSAWSMPIRFISITHNTGVNLNANGNADQALDWLDVNFLNCDTVGVIANYNNFLMTDSTFLNSGGLTFDGSFGTVGFSQCLFEGSGTGSVIILPATLVLSSRFKIIYSSFVVIPGETGIEVSASANIPTEGYILDTVNFAGDGTYTSGVAFSDNKASWVNNRGVENSAEIAVLTMTGNSTATVIDTINTPVKVAGTTTLDSSVSQKFTHTNNRATYSGAVSRNFKITATLSVASGNNNQIGVYIAKNATVIPSSETYLTANSSGRTENSVVQSVVSLSQGDYVEVWVKNASGTANITVVDMSIITESLN